MCGRFKIGSSSIAKLKAVTNHEIPSDVAAHLPTVWNNFQPGNFCAVITKSRSGKLELKSAVWGLVPAYENAESNHWRMFNARSETALEKSVFKTLVSENRCVVVIEGYFEWKKSGSIKTPHYITFQKPMLVCGLYTYNAAFDITTFTILTAAPPQTISAIHDRCPMVLTGDCEIEEWLQGQHSAPLDTFLSRESPLASPSLVKFWVVSSKMALPSYQEPDTDHPVQKASCPVPTTPPKKQTAIAAFFSPSATKPTNIAHTETGPSKSDNRATASSARAACETKKSLFAPAAKFSTATSSFMPQKPPSVKASAAKNDVIDLTGVDEDDMPAVQAQEDVEAEAVCGKKRLRAASE